MMSPTKTKPSIVAKMVTKAKNPVHEEHGQDHSHQEQAGRDNVTQTLVEGLADRINVIGHARQSISPENDHRNSQRRLFYLLCNSRPQPLRKYWITVLMIKDWP